MAEKTSSSSISESTTYEVHYKNWKTIITVNDFSGKQLYALSKENNYKECVLTDAAGAKVGSTIIHTMTHKIDVEIAGDSGNQKEFWVGDTKWFNGSPTYFSPAFGGEQMTWKHNKAWTSKIGYTLVDKEDVEIAKFESNPKTRIGTLAVADKALGKEQMDEVALIILTLSRRKMMDIETATIVAIT